MSIKAGVFLPFAREDVWSWFTMPGSTERLAPNSLPITHILADTNHATGSSVYSFPAGLKWITRYELSSYQRGRSFTETCVRGPFRPLTDWSHQHHFMDAKEFIAAASTEDTTEDNSEKSSSDATSISLVDSSLPYSPDVDLKNPKGTILENRFIAKLPERNLRAYFGYYHNQLLRDLCLANDLGLLDSQRDKEAHPFTIAVTGTSSTIGQPLIAQLQTLGFNVKLLPRKNGSRSKDPNAWDPKKPAANLLNDVDLLIHLAGESLQGRANDGHYQAIRDSRLGPTVELAKLVSASPRCKGMIMDSVDCGDERLTSIFTEIEEAARAHCANFLPIRRAAVFSARSGLLPLLRAVHKTGLGGKLGSLETQCSWISIDDLTDIYARAVHQLCQNGDSHIWPRYYTAVAPEKITTATLMETLARRFNTRTIIPIPDFSPRLLLGEPGARLLIARDHALQAELPEGHRFRYPTIDAALAHELMGEKPPILNL
ncbi:MAG: DUF1731 domain-containing protein [Corynebacterium sp.]|nr:DUF1731 domain-containing protein [Corynebacterium sp.]